MKSVTLLVGEVFVDFTLTEPGAENKLRLGGITHAARGFWALGVPFRAAVVLPEYLEGLTRGYLAKLGCIDCQVVGYVRGAPNVTVIADATEVADQGYDTLLREEKTVDLISVDFAGITPTDILIFPGSYDLQHLCVQLPPTGRLHLDVAYDVDSAKALSTLPRIETILMSTSSPLFQSLPEKTLSNLSREFESIAPSILILKENRGGARLVLAGSSEYVGLPAQLGTTVNSVGVGDVFAAAFVSHVDRGPIEAGWRATYAAAAYSQTTYPDQFRTYVQRDLKLSTEEMLEFWGTFLPWEMRQQYPIYLAAPDFKEVDRRAIDRALASLGYHNFAVRRPVVENGELPAGSDAVALKRTFNADYELLKKCALVFAVPTGRDPGTLVEVGIAIEANVPVVVYDPERENANTMVMAGAQHYSPDLDSCLNAVFRVLSGSAPQ